MNFAVCGNLFNVQQISEIFRDITLTYELNFDRPRRGGGTSPSFLPSINLYEFRRLINAHQLEGLLLNMDANAAKKIIKTCKLYEIPRVCVLRNYPFNPVYVLDTHKGFLTYAETNLIDSCNLNCSGCTHYANLFTDEDFYKLDDFERDIQWLAAFVDVLQFRLLGGEPFKLPNLIDYVRIARKYFPQTDFRLVTNALLIPAASQELLDAIRENMFIIDISHYPPTEKVMEKVSAILNENQILFGYSSRIDYFNAFLTLHGGHDPEKARAVCCDDGCRFLRGGKIYKCPVDALSFKLVEEYGLQGFPKPTSVTIGAPNFVSLLEELDGNIECCYWCNENVRRVNWRPSNKPTLDEWLANPMETLNVCSFKK